MRLDIVTIFPDYFTPLDVSLLGKARQRGIVDIRVHDLRTWARDRHRTVDDTPYGGGPGMVMKPEPWGEALDAIIGPPGSSASANPVSEGAADAGAASTDTAGTYPAGAYPPGTFPGSTNTAGTDTAKADADPTRPAATNAAPEGATAAGGVPAGNAGARAACEGAAGTGSAAAAFAGISGVGAIEQGAAGTDSAAAAAAASGGKPGAGAGAHGTERTGSATSGATAGAPGGIGPPVPGGSPRLVVPTPSGRPFTQRDALAYAREPWLVLACGRYEGIDARVIAAAAERMPVDEVSIGDYVLAGGEAAALVIIETVTRLLPGVLGNAASAADDSFAPGPMEGLLEGPTYTKPASWRGRDVPPVLISGDHAAIDRWRRDEALRRTVANRPELAARLDPATLDEHDRAVLEEAGFPVGGGDMAH